jgi:glycerol-3-phosphate dehydrogenase
MRHARTDDGAHRARTGDGALNAPRRARELAEATDRRVVDVLVVGLGVTGSGAALDAAARGLDVVAVDAHDLAFGTSRWSSKLVHGGLRYLARGQLGVAYESAYERGVLMSHTAPHLVRPLPMLMPLLSNVSRRQSAFLLAGLHAGDVLRLSAHTGAGVLPRARRVARPEALQMVPCARRRGLRGGLLSWDGQLEDDARLVVALARTAAAHGARILTRCRVLELHGDGALVRDELSGTVSSVKARTVINAAGVWVGSLVPGISLRPSRGTHLVLRASTLSNLTAAVTAPIPGESTRFVFALPQADGLVYVGLTDEPLDGPPPDVPVPSEAEIDFLLEMIGTVFEDPIRRADVVGSFAGLRPLLDADGPTADLSRRHTVLTSPDGVVTVVGGKLTTYRRMAQDAVDTVVARAGLLGPPCRTHRLPLLGAAGRDQLAELPAPGRLVRRYGIESTTLTRDPDLLAPIGDGLHATMAELVWGVTHEGAADVGDLLDRRTRIGLVPADRVRAVAAAEQALELGRVGLGSS